MQREYEAARLRHHQQQGGYYDGAPYNSTQTAVINQQIPAGVQNVDGTFDHLHTGSLVPVLPGEEYINKNDHLSSFEVKQPNPVPNPMQGRFLPTAGGDPWMTSTHKVAHDPRDPPD